MTSDNLFATIFLVLLAFDLVLVVILARKWAPRCQKCGCHVNTLPANYPYMSPVKVCRGCGYVEVL